MGAFERAATPPFNKYCTCCRSGMKQKRERIWKGVAKAGQRRFRFCPVCDLNEPAPANEGPTEQ